ncbi:MAG: CGNR zinc finger domain-containing protein [Actinobacteria bacterium]|nr:CGNR zinc finger domain-containing protein [Actinomycetota bacterium]
MDFSHYTDEPVDLAIALVNTAQTKTDRIGDLSRLRAFLDDYRHMWEGIARPVSKGDLEPIHRLREALRSVIDSPDDAAASAMVNRILAEHGAQPRVSVHNGDAHFHFEPFDSSMSCWLGATTAMGLASVMVENGMSRFGVCNADDCDDVYVDASRNRSRRHCSSTCSTREAVTAYRRRQNAGVGADG